MMRIAIVEDEEEFRTALKNYIDRYASESGETIRVSMFTEGLTFLEEYHGGYDLILMDILMPHMSGMETARKLRLVDETVVIVFITSMVQYAIQGYEVNAAAYLVKPAAYGQFSDTMDRIRRTVLRTETATVIVSQKENSVVLPVRKIAYIEVYNHSLVFHTQDSSYEMRGSLTEYETDPRFEGFVKVSKSHMVNVAFIAAIDEDTLTVAGDVLPLTRRRKKECMEKIAKVIGGGIV